MNRDRDLHDYLRTFDVFSTGSVFVQCLHLLAGEDRGTVTNLEAAPEPCQ